MDMFGRRESPILPANEREGYCTHVMRVPYISGSSLGDERTLVDRRPSLGESEKDSSLGTHHCDGMPKYTVLAYSGSHSLSASSPSPSRLSPFTLHCSLLTSRLSPVWLPLIGTFIIFNHCIYWPFASSFLFIWNPKLYYSHYIRQRPGMVTERHYEL